LVCPPGVADNGEIAQEKKLSPTKSVLKSVAHDRFAPPCTSLLIVTARNGRVSHKMTSFRRLIARSLLIKRWRIIYSLALLYVLLLVSSMHDVASRSIPSLFYFAGQSEKVQNTSNNKTLALLYFPGMIGGYRNQVMRFVALVRHAQRYGQTQLLLPSLVFSTTYKEQSPNQFFPIPMDEIFDVEYWNKFRQYLPILVDSLEDTDCWNQLNDVDDNDRDFLQQLQEKFGSKVIRIRPANETTFTSPMLDKLLRRSMLLTPIAKTNKAILNGRVEILKPRKIDLSPEVERCSHPYVYGGGRLGGKLWNEYVHMPKIDPGGENSIHATENSEFISLVSQALLPSRKWRNVAHQCILEHQFPLSNSNEMGFQERQKQAKLAPYVVLHARVETEMLEHRCGVHMEKNLTRIISMVESMVVKYNADKQQDGRLKGIVLAVSRYGMERKARSPVIQEIVDRNWETLKRNSLSFGKDIVRSNKGGKPEIFECGETWMDRWYSMQADVPNDYYGSLVPSVLNYYIATHAAIFVGVEGSSWSTDVFTSRFGQGKGSANFQYTPDGIIPVANSGLPPSHNDCN
jgi:hypothetical protein